MPTLTVTIPVETRQTPDTGSPPAGLKLTLTRVRDGAAASPPVSTSLVWTFPNVSAGDAFTLRVASVRADGSIIAELPIIEITSPPAQAGSVAYMHPLNTALNPVQIAWS